MIIDPKDQKKALFHYFFKGEMIKRFYDVSANAIGLINSFLVITYLSVFQFGLYQLLLAFIAILESLNTGLFDSIVGVDIRRYFNVGKINFAKRLFLENAVFKIVTSIILTAVVFFGADIIAQFYGEDVTLFLKIVSFLLIIRSIQALETTLFKATLTFSHWSRPAIRELSKLLLILGFLVFSKLTIFNVITAYVVAEVISLAVLTLFAFIKIYRKAFGITPAHNNNLLIDLIRNSGKWALVRYGFAKATKNTMPWFIKFFINTEAVAFYSMAVNIFSLIESLMPMQGLAEIFALKVDSKSEVSFIFKRALKYSLWLGVLFLLGSAILVPPVIALIFPKYSPAIPIFLVIMFSMPLYGVYKMLKILLSTLREHKILALRLINEALIFPIGSVIFLPTLGVVGVGFIYIAAYLERVWFFYRSLIAKYPEFKIKAKNLVEFETTDKEFFVKVARQLFLFFKLFLRRIKTAL